jgi:hypothetical protein
MESNKPWIVADNIAIPCAQHPLPKYPKKLLPKFDLDNDVTPKDHMKQFMLSLILKDVEHEYVVWIFFCIPSLGKIPHGFSFEP